MFFIPPPELHLLLGATNTLYENLLSIWPQAEKWPQKIFASRKPYHGGEFVGNDCAKLLSDYSIGELQRLGEEAENLEIPHFVEAFKSLKKVSKSCFGNILGKDFKEVCAEFRNKILALMDLGVTNCTPKFHIIFFHVPFWCETYNVGLGKFSEQAGESAHREFFKSWTRSKRKPDDPEFGNWLLKAVTTFNAKNL